MAAYSHVQENGVFPQGNSWLINPSNYERFNDTLKAVFDLSQALALGRLGKYDQANRLMDQLLSKPLSDPNLAFMLYFHKGCLTWKDRDTAIAYIEKAKLHAREIGYRLPAIDLENGNWPDKLIPHSPNYALRIASGYSKKISRKKVSGQKQEKVSVSFSPEFYPSLSYN